MKEMIEMIDKIEDFGLEYNFQKTMKDFKSLSPQGRGGIVSLCNMVFDHYKSHPEKEWYIERFKKEGIPYNSFDFLQNRRVLLYLEDSHLNTVGSDKSYEDIRIQIYPERLKKFLSKAKRYKIEEINNRNLYQYQIVYDAFSCTISIQDYSGKSKVLAKAKFDSMPERIFNIIYDCPDRFTKSSLEKAINKKIKSLPKVVESLNFKGNFLKSFIRVSQKSIQLRKTITPEEFAVLNIDPLI